MWQLLSKARHEVCLEAVQGWTLQCRPCSTHCVHQVDVLFSTNVSRAQKTRVEALQLNPYLIGSTGLNESADLIVLSLSNVSCMHCFRPQMEQQLRTTGSAAG